MSESMYIIIIIMIIIIVIIAIKINMESCDRQTHGDLTKP